MKETYDIIIEKLEQDKLSFDREISEVIDYVEYDSIAKLGYDRAKAKRDYCIDLIEYLWSNHDNSNNAWYKRQNKMVGGINERRN